jgi:all-trans-retinol dehydrogenase (NAD+)
MTDLSKSTVLVTGAASGLGRRLALGCARRGAPVVLWDLNREALSAVVKEVQALGVAAESDVVDVSDREGVYDAARRVSGPVDVLVNNAGVVSGKSFLEISDEKIEASFRVNALALFWTTKAFLPGMIERGRGHLVTIASAAGLIGVARLSDYCATKWAAVGLDESLRVELAKTAPAIRTTVVCPFYIATGMFEGVKSRFPFLLPILDEETAAARVLRAVERNERKLAMPFLVKTLPLLRLLPVSWFDAIAHVMGINVAMDEFVGRHKS